MASDGDLQPRVTRLVVYPVKGCAGQPCEQVEVEARGLAWDRRWMFVGEDGGFLDLVPPLRAGRSAGLCG